MRVLHTEASKGWGGQEIRILREALAMRSKGHTVIVAVNKGGKLFEKAREKGLIAYEAPMSKIKSLKTLWQLCRIIKRHHIDLVNTHSSLDAWLGGTAARLMRKKIVRTRHLSTPIRPGLNSIILYHWLADHVVATCEAAAKTIRLQARLPEERCHSIPTGLDETIIRVTKKETQDFRQKHGLQPSDFIIGTLCVLRSWKGISEMLRAAEILKDQPRLKWLIVGDGPSANIYRKQCQRWGLEEKVIFTGYQENPCPALAAMDIFMLLSTAHEGVSQASLQAAFLEKPLITTTTGGLPEVCQHGMTGYHVENFVPEQVARHVMELVNHPHRRQHFGQQAKALVKNQFLWTKTISEMEKVYEMHAES